MSGYLSPLAGAGAQFFTNQGVVLAGGKLYSYTAGSSTPYGTWTSSNLSTLNANPIILDSSGRPPQEIWLDSSSYKFILTDANGNVIGSWDDIYGISGTVSSSANTAVGIPFLQLTNVANAYQGNLTGYVLDGLGRPTEGFPLIVGVSGTNAIGAATLSVDNGLHSYPVISPNSNILNAGALTNKYDALVIFSDVLQSWILIGAPPNSSNANIEFNIQGANGAVITAGVKGYLDVPYNCTITGWSMYSTLTGSIDVDIQTASYTNFPLVTSITGGAPPNLVSAVKNQVSAPAGWSINVTAGTVLAFVVTGTPAVVNNVTISLQVTK